MLNPKAAGAVDVAELPFSSADHGLPLDAENTDALPYHLIIRLFEACETLEPAFESASSPIMPAMMAAYRFASSRKASMAGQGWWRRGSASITLYSIPVGPSARWGSHPHGFTCPMWGLTPTSSRSQVCRAPRFTGPSS
ncbi:hypothetical protein AMTR_s00479p00008910 [Amborella trichopoda]|uniref:Uncharacterized protein n=1 Tax=Amborella trichopoda TaxID=13333 RepID=W1NNY8_AMBTC|nr:hypothetical protein AMTR_s00479p00008910 [Amborella trichopoda]